MPGIVIKGWHPPRNAARVPSTTRRVPLDCIHAGDPLPSGDVAARGLSTQRVWRPCAHPQKPLGDPVCTCRGCGPKCEGYTPDEDEGPARERVTQEGFNCSEIVHRGQLYTATRRGWAGSQIIVNGVTLHGLRQPAAAYGREDPRLFIYRDTLHVAYTGVVGGRRAGITTNVCYARLTDDLKVEQVFAPVYDRRAAWEKNWSFFEADGDLYCVYSISPHRILKVDGNKAVDFSETPLDLPWSGGYLRGGTSPVLHRDRFYHFFHGAIDLGSAWPTRIYNIGLYTFEPQPPFRILALSPDPLLWADHKTRPADQYCSVLFPGGAYRKDNGWSVSCGVHDRWSERIYFDDSLLHRSDTNLR